MWEIKGRFLRRTVETLRNALEQNPCPACQVGTVCADSIHHAVMFTCLDCGCKWSIKGRILVQPAPVIMTTENSPASMAENSPTLVKFLPRILGRDRCWGSRKTEGARRATGVSPLPRKTQYICG